MTSTPYVLEKGDHLVLHFDERAMQSAMWKEDPYHLVLFPFQAMMWSTLLCPNPASIGNIGLGGGDIAKWCWRYFPAARVSVAEIDANVIGIATKHFAIPLDSERFTVLHEDGADYVARLTGELDLLVVDGATSMGVPHELGSERFYETCWSALRVRGVAVFNLDAGPRSQDRIRWIARRFNGVCWSATSPYNGQTIVFGKRPANPPTRICNPLHNRCSSALPDSGLRSPTVWQQFTDAAGRLRGQPL
jgi:spermidine synthase